jgi:dTDP-4-amino-4,6-dideoxygalactose transaminase
MHPIQMVDLKKQYAKIKAEVDKSVHEVLDTAGFINGKAVGDFAENLSKYWE